MKKPNLKHLLLWAFTAAALTLGACKTDLSGIESDIDDLKGKVSELENAIDELRSAYEAGKIITSVESIDYAENNGGGIW